MALEMKAACMKCDAPLEYMVVLATPKTCPWSRSIAMCGSARSAKAPATFNDS